MDILLTIVKFNTFWWVLIWESFLARPDSLACLLALLKLVVVVVLGGIFCYGKNKFRSKKRSNFITIIIAPISKGFTTHLWSYGLLTRCCWWWWCYRSGHKNSTGKEIIYEPTNVYFYDLSLSVSLLPLLLLDGELTWECKRRSLLLLFLGGTITVKICTHKRHPRHTYATGE